MNLISQSEIFSPELYPDSQTVGMLVGGVLFLFLLFRPGCVGCNYFASAAQRFCQSLFSTRILKFVTSNNPYRLWKQS